jgi:hypothetical protein
MAGPGSVRPIGASAFGDLFFERRTGGVEKLDVLEGGLRPVAASFEEFSNLMNSEDWQKAHLLSNGVALLKDKGVSKTQAQFFGFAPHPSFAGKIVWSSVLPLVAIVWHSICAQTLGQSEEAFVEGLVAAQLRTLDAEAEFA